MRVTDRLRAGIMRRVPDAALSDYYAARAREYDRVYEKPERQADLRAIEAWLPAWFAGRRVLELASGTGWWTRLIAPVAAHVTATDAVDAPLAIARERLKDRANVSFAIADAYAPPRADPPFDAVFAGFWLSHVPRARWRAFLDRLQAILDTRATVVLIDNRYVEGSSTAIALRDAAGDTWQDRRLSDGSVHRVLKNFPERAELEALAAPYGGSAEVVQWPFYWGLAYRSGDRRSA
jgi:demethylmenaquinone methyltransferase/2-methoxy-6-polyprenyl-1,4-benzoquinol methylase